jgi:hypothetical protein
MPSILAPPLASLVPQARANSSSSHQISARYADRFLGFNNRTCAAGTDTLPAGPGVGPALRAGGTSWTSFSLAIAGHGGDGADLAVISTFFKAGAAQPLCMGSLVAEKRATCGDPRVHIHPAAQAGSGTRWALKRTGVDSFTIRYTGRDSSCAVYLTAPAACGAAGLTLENASGSALQQWVLEPIAVKMR